MWFFLSIGSAFFAGISSVLAKCGIEKTSSEVATAIRTAIVIAMSVIMTLIVGSLKDIGSIDAKTWIFLILSGSATGASWLCFFKALELGDVNKVIPVDKTSTILTLIVSFIVFGETVTWVKIVSVVAIGAGTFFMIERKQTSGQRRNGKWWLLFACLSAVFASLTSILGKIGIDGVESNLGTLIRTIVVLFMSWIVVFVTGKTKNVGEISKRDFLFIVFSGIATGVSWLCYYKALKDGVVSVVVSVDKLSILVTIAFSFFALKEKLTVKALIGLVLILAGTVALSLSSLL